MKYLFLRFSAPNATVTGIANDSSRDTSRPVVHSDWPTVPS